VLLLPGTLAPSPHTVLGSAIQFWLEQVNAIFGAGRIASWLLFATVALAPLPFGSVEPYVVAFWCIVLGTCLVLAPVRSLTAGRFALAGLAGIIFAAYALVLHEQLVEHPWLPIAIPQPLWHEAQAALGLSLTPSVSISRDQPWFALGRSLVCLLAMTCSFLIGADRARARQLINVIAWSGGLYAAYGIWANIFDPTHILELDKRAYLGSLTGTFVNRNTAGAYFGTCAVVWSLLLWERIRLEMSHQPLGWRALASRILSNPPRDLILRFAMFFLCLAAMFMSRSRGAVILSLFALVVAFTAFFRHEIPKRSGLVAMLSGGCAVSFVLLQLLGAGVNSRFDLEGLSEGGRLETYRATLRMISDHPWFGTGLGTFAAAFPAYRSPDVSMWGIWDLAHNTLLEIAAEMGLPIAVLVVIAWIMIFSVLIRGTFVRRRDLIFPVVALAVAMLAVLHSMIDFSLQIPGYAVVALSLVGVGLTQSVSIRRLSVDVNGQVLSQGTP
jgi:O-antigen ligase